MPKFVRTARGDMVDFDLLAIKNQLASAPVPKAVNDRVGIIKAVDAGKPLVTAAPAPTKTKTPEDTPE